ncbi:MAG: hypothetical protein U0P48_06075 [Ancrocorticia sp.]
MRQHPSQIPSHGRPQRSKPKFISGIILVVLAGLFLPSAITVIQNAVSSSSADTTFIVGSAFGAMAIPVVLLILGVVLILKSRPKR